MAFTGCDNDDDDLYDTLSGRVWAGDLGFYQDGRIPLDRLCLFRGGRLRYRRAPLRRHGALPRHAQHPEWDAYDDKIYISYGRADYPRRTAATYTSAGAG
ncbi:MAG: hypothetical protein ACLUQ6_12390 [Alistipes onderdonkii]